MIQYQGPDIRGRTAASPAPINPTDTQDRQFLLMLKPLTIRASDLERIPREGSLSINPVDLPAIGIAPAKTVLRNRVISQTVLATPGVATGIIAAPATVGPNPQIELECKPLVTMNGANYIIHDASGAAAGSGLGARNPMGGPKNPSEGGPPPIDPTIVGVFCIAILAGVLFWVFIFDLWYKSVYISSTALKTTPLIMKIMGLGIVITVMSTTYPGS